MFVDEAGINLALTRLYARAINGERAVDNIPRNTGENVSLIGALSLDGFIAPMTIPGSVDTTVFLTYVTLDLGASVMARSNRDDGQFASSPRTVHSCCD